MGELGRLRVSNALSWEHSVPELLRAYDHGLGLGSQRRAANGTSSGRT